MNGPLESTAHRFWLALGGGLSLLGAASILLGLAGTAGQLAGLGAVILGVAISAPFSSSTGAVLAQWWNLQVLGGLCAMLGTALALAFEAPGGLLAGLGAVLVLTAAVLGPLSAALANR